MAVICRGSVRARPLNDSAVGLPTCRLLYDAKRNMLAIAKFLIFRRQAGTDTI